jgi:hypothetical protein
VFEKYRENSEGFLKAQKKAFEIYQTLYQKYVSIKRG